MPLRAAPKACCFIERPWHGCPPYRGSGGGNGGAGSSVGPFGEDDDGVSSRESVAQGSGASGAGGQGLEQWGRCRLCSVNRESPICHLPPLD